MFNIEEELKKLKATNSVEVFEREDLQVFLEQLACYFVFRHFENGIGFTLLSCWVVGVICSACKSLEEMIDIARMYSSEIEYSEENTEKVEKFIEEK